MSKKGGYQILDLKGYAFTAGTEATLDGVYDVIEGNYNKPILLSGLKVGTTDYADAYVTFGLSGTSFVTTVYGYNIVIAEDDGITVTAVTDPIASASKLGMIKVGTGLTIGSDGKLSVSGD